MTLRPFVILTALLLSGCGERDRTPAPRTSQSGGDAVTLVGRVTFNTEETDKDLEGATVRLQATQRSVLTQSDGRFTLSIARIDLDRRPTVTVSKPGFVIQGVAAHELLESNDPSKVIRLEPIPIDTPNYEWVDPHADAAGSHQCENCHQEIFDQWAQGAHRSAADGKQFLEMYAGRSTSTDDRRVDGHDWSLVDEYPEGAGVCASCHAPSASIDQLGVADMREINGVASLGVHCDFCHKIGEVDLPALGLTHGRFAMELNRPESGQFFFGPLDDVDRGEDSFLPLQSESRFCAPCHEGTVFGTPVYTTYSEWLASPAAAAGKQCQSCHMAPDGVMTNIAEGHGGLERDPQTLASHILLPDGRMAMLKRALKLNVETAEGDDARTVDVTVLARDVGHRVPTGYIDRHLLLVVEGRDTNGSVHVAASGLTLGDEADDWSGKNGVLFAKQLKPSTSSHPIPFWRPAGEILDTRLRPEQPESYRFTFSEEVVKVRVQLLYRKFWRKVERAKQWPDSTIVVYEQTVELD